MNYSMIKWNPFHESLKTAIQHHGYLQKPFHFHALWSTLWGFSLWGIFTNTHTAHQKIAPLSCLRNTQMGLNGKVNNFDGRGVDAANYQYIKWSKFQKPVIHEESSCWISESSQTKTENKDSARAKTHRLQWTLM